MRPLLFWTFHAFAKLEFAVDFGFSLIAVGSDHLAHGIKPDFLKTISDQRADFRPLCALCAETGIIRTRLGRTLKFSKVGKKSSPILVFPASLKYRLLVAPERAACRVRATLWHRGGALGTWVWISRCDRTVVHTRSSSSISKSERAHVSTWTVRA